MLVKMRPDATKDEVAAVERKLHGLGYKTGKLVGTEITLIGVYGDISRLPQGEFAQMPGVERLIPISRAYKRAAHNRAWNYSSGCCANSRTITIGFCAKARPA